MKIHYDPETDVLYIAKEGEENETVEIHPGISLELDGKGELIGIEILNASRMLKDVIKPLEKRAAL
jgi:uncharacterized protein YuzE